MSQKVQEIGKNEMIVIEYYKKGQIFNVDKILEENNIESVVKPIKTKAHIIKADEVYINSSDGSNRRLRLKLYTLFIHNFMYDTRRTVKKVNKLYLKTYLQNGNESDYLCKAYRLIIRWYIRNKNSITLANLAFSDWIDTRVWEVGSIYTGDNAKKFVEDYLDMIAVLEETN